MIKDINMHEKAFNLGNSWKPPRPGNSMAVVQNLAPQGGFNIRNEYHHIMSQGSFFPDWRKDPGISHYRNSIRSEISAILISRRPYDQGQASALANFLENRLFTDAASQDEYMNRATLMQRLNTQVKKLHAQKCSEQVNASIACTSKMVPSSGLFRARSNGSAPAPQPAFQKVACPITTATDSSAMAVDHLSADNHLSNTTTCTGLDVLRNFFVSGEKSNLNASSKSVDSYFPQRQANDWKMHLMKYEGCSTTTMGKSVRSESSNLLSPQHVFKELSKVNNLSPGSSSLGDIRQNQHQKRDFQHFMQPVLHGKTYMAQPNSLSVNQRSMLWEKFKRPRLFTRSINESQQFTSESSAYTFGLDGSANSSKISDEQRILLEYYYYREFSIISRDTIMNYLHATACRKRTCTCAWYSKLLLHFDDCTDDGCQTCYSWQLRGTDILESGLEFPNSKVLGSVERKNYAPSGKCEDVLPTAKRRKKESTSSGDSLIRNSCLGQLTHKMVQPPSSEAFPELQQQQVSSLPLDSNMHPICKESMPSRIAGNQDVLIESKADREKSPSPTVIAHMEDIQGKTSLNQDGVDATEKVIVPKASLNPTINADMEDILDRTELNQDEIDATEKVIEPKADGEKPKPTVTADMEDVQGRTWLNQNGIDATEKVIEAKADGEKSPNPTVTDDMEEDIQGRTVLNQDGIDATEKVIELKADGEKSPNPTITEDMEKDIQGRTWLNQDGLDVTEKVIEQKADVEKSPSSTVTEGIEEDIQGRSVSLTDFFTSNQIMEHITSLRNQFNQSTMVEESGIDVYKCQLCGVGTISFAPVPIYCFCCGIRIKRNACYYYKREEDDTQHCFCSVCFRTSRGGHITFNGISVSKTDLDKKTNNREFEEPWVECNKCKSWQHQICALYNDKRDLDYRAEYTCPQCRLKEIANGMHVPLPKTAMFDAKDLPKTMLSDHIERRLFERLRQENEDWAKVEGNKNLDEVLEEESISVRVVLSVEKQLKVKQQFLNIFEEENYPAESPYTSKVILLFQKIEGVDVCLFAMFVQEFGSECGYPNQRSVYISYLDSVKYFRPERKTKSGEALRTIVYHEILIGYLDFCKKRGFTTCYIWACPPIKGEDYILYCHPDTQKTPKKDKLRHWYHSMLRKAAEENIVVGLTNIYDHYFVTTGNCDSKVTAARLPYFDGDFWSGAAMDKARHIEQECRGNYTMIFDKVVSKRCLKSMGHVNPSKGTAKDILVMYKLGQTILPFKEDFIVAQLQFVCMHCREVIVNGKRWFCTECKKFQECERCHTADSHISDKGDRHKLCQVLMDDVLGDTKENDIILDNGLFDSRHNFLSFCQRNRFQFDSLRRAKYSSMMILHLVKNPTLLTVGTICRICSKNNVSQRYWKCKNCPEFTVCSACYNERGVKCHAHTLSEAYSPAQSPSGNQELQQNNAMLQGLLDVIKHASQCHSTKTQPCTYPHCLQIKKLFAHASRCNVRVSGGCQFCKKVWQGLALHSRNCRDSACRIPRCMDLKKQAEWRATQSESRHRAAVLQLEDSK